MTTPSRRVPTLAVFGCRAEAELLAQAVGGLARVVIVEPHAANGLWLLRDTPTDYVLLFLDHEPDAILDLTRQVAQSGASVPIVASAERRPDDILRAMRAGAREFVHYEPDGRDVVRALRDLIALAPPAASAQGKMIAVFGCKGGSGATTIGINLAAALRGAGEHEPLDVAVIDVDPERGDVLTYLDLTSEYGFREMQANLHRLDKDMLLHHALAVHDGGLRVLAHIEAAEDGHWLGPADLEALLTVLRHNFDFVVVDGLRDFRELSLSVLDSADYVLATMTQDIPALKNAARCDKLFRRLGYGDTKVRLAVNRYRSSGSITADAIADALGRRVDATVANDFPLVVKSINEGRLVIEKDASSRVAKDLRALVPLFHEVAPPKRKSLFAGWGRR
jgi:pilus assembly protein CpaE